MIQTAKLMQSDQVSLHAQLRHRQGELHRRKSEPVPLRERVESEPEAEETDEDDGIEVIDITHSSDY